MNMIYRNSKSLWIFVPNQSKKALLTYKITHHPRYLIRCKPGSELRNHPRRCQRRKLARFSKTMIVRYAVKECPGEHITGTICINRPNLIRFNIDERVAIINHRSVCTKRNYEATCNFL